MVQKRVKIHNVSPEWNCTKQEIVADMIGYMLCFVVQIYLVKVSHYTLTPRGEHAMVSSNVHNRAKRQLSFLFEDPEDRLP